MSLPAIFTLTLAQFGLALAVAAPIGSQSAPPQPAANAALLVRAGRLLTMDGEPIHNGQMLIEGGRIRAIGNDIEAPPGARLLDLGDRTICPGFVDLHHHVGSGGFDDINDMVHALNPELRLLDAIRAGNDLIKDTVSGGVTTTLFIPGSGTFISGFGVLMKMSGDAADKVVIRKLGAMKVAQGYNPERYSGDLGQTRMGSSHELYALLERGKVYAEAWRRFRAGDGPRPKLDAALEQLRLVFDKEVPVIIHTAGARDCVATARMFQDVHDVRMILSHGTFDGHWAASALARRKTPVNLGPRMYDFTKEGRFQGIAEGYYRVGCTNLSLNTDAPVIEPEMLLLQGSMAVRLGLPWRAAMEGLTIVPARQIGIADRVGSLTKGKDADFLVTAGDPLDPRNRIEQVFIEGKLVYRAGDTP